MVEASGRWVMGKTSPSNKLDVNGVIAGTYFVDYSNNAYGFDPAGTSNFGGYSQKITGGALLAVDSGNVGIGNATPIEKLDVTGNIHATNRIDTEDHATSVGLKIPTFS